MLLFNRYEYNPQTDTAGKGAFSRVYKAVDTNTSETVAIKIYKINDLSNHYRPVQDAAIIRTLDHVGLCQYFDIQEIEKEDSFGEKEKLEVCITAFMNAGTLLAYHKEHKDAALLAKLVQDILSGLSYLHRKNITHGYIKPSNLLVTANNTGAAAAITDFAMGIAHQDGFPGSSSSPFLQDTAYLSPEQLNPKQYGIAGKIAANTDLWSLAAVVYEALTGTALLITNEEMPENSLARINQFELPSTIDTLPAPFPAMLKACLVKNAAQRAKTADEVLAIFGATDTAAVEILQLEEKNISLQEPENTLVSTEEADDTADTRMIALPKKDNTSNIDSPVKENTDDDTKIVVRATVQPATALPVEKEIAEEDATQVIQKPAAPAADDTKVIVPPTGHQAAQESTDDDATQIIKKPVADPVKQEAITDEDATRVIAKPGSKTAAGQPAPEEPPVDQTIIIAKVNKEQLAAKNSTEDAKPVANEDRQPDVIVRRREKPVVLFNRYDYLPATDLIGKGGFSRVYKAFDKKLSRWVALKIYKTGEFSDRYSPIAEIKRVVNLDHPNICRYLDIEEIENENPFGENEKIQVCVMELLDSGTFADYYKNNKNPETLKKLIQDILNGLSYLHKNGIIHRDIKPGNILIKQTIEGPVAKITDFGISKNSDADNNNSSSALIVSIPYMAPEQLNAKKYGINEKISFNLDLWSLGVTIYEVFTGKVLFKNSDQDNSEQIMANIMAPELPEKLHDLPEPFRTIVAHCVIKNARERASRAEELMVLLHTTTPAAGTTEILVSQAANSNAGKEQDAILSQHAEPETLARPIFISPPPQPSVEEKKSNSRFSISEPEEKPVVIEKEEKKKNYLLIFISTAVAIFILFIIYLKTSNPNPTPVLPNSTVKKDTAHTTVTAAPVIADTTHKEVPAADKKTDSTTKPAEVVAKPVHTEKKKEKPVAETHKKETPAAEKTSANTASKYVLLLSAETDCTLKVNGINYGEIQTGKPPLKIYLATGKYILQFISSSNSASTYTANIEVKPENMGHADKFKIPLK